MRVGSDKSEHMNREQWDLTCKHMELKRKLGGWILHVHFRQ